MGTATPWPGTVAPGFEPVREAFLENFRTPGEVGAVYLRGEKVVDLRGDRRDPATGAPWEQDTMVPVFATTKGMSALALAVAHARGLYECDAPVATYWPEFARHDKGAITVRQLLLHHTGLAVLDAPLDAAGFADLDGLAEALAAQRPAWAPGRAHGYHAITPVAGHHRHAREARAASCAGSTRRVPRGAMDGSVDVVPTAGVSE